jgi:hypothetical protein
MANSFDDMTSGKEEGSGSTELATVQAVQTVLSAAPEFDKDDLQHPKLRLAQGLTPEVQDGAARPGDWVLNGFDPEKAVTIVPLLMGKDRARRDDDNNLLCSSGDGKTGVGTPGGDCSACPFAKWRPNPKDPKGKNLPPECGLGYVYVAFSITHDCLVQVDFRKSAATVGKTLNSLVNSKGLGQFAVTLSGKSESRTVRGKQVTFGVPLMAPAKVDPDELERARDALL